MSEAAIFGVWREDDLQLAARSMKNPQALLIDFDKRRIARYGQVVRLTPLYFRTVAVLAVACGGWVDYGVILDALYGDCESGGPDDARNAVYQVHAKLKPMIDLLGLRIDTYARVGMRMEIDKIIMMEAAE